VADAADGLEEGDLVDGGFGGLDDGGHLIQGHGVVARDDGGKALGEFGEIATFGVRVDGRVDDLEGEGFARRFSRDGRAFGDVNGDFCVFASQPSGPKEWGAGKSGRDGRGEGGFEGHGGMTGAVGATGATGGQKGSVGRSHAKKQSVTHQK